MLPGLNNDIEYEGKIYHVQTEDTGPKNPMIVTTLFQSGAILATRKSSYSDILSTENLPLLLRQRMHDQHMDMIRDLQAGRISRESSQPSIPPSVRERPSQPPNAGPALDPSAAPATGGRKSLDEMILDYLSTKEERKKS